MQEIPEKTFVAFEYGKVMLEADGTENVFVYIFQKNIERFEAGVGVYADQDDQERAGFIRHSIPIQSLKARDTDYRDVYVNTGMCEARPAHGRYAGNIYISKI